MNCIFCGNVSEKRWHLDCFETAIEEEFGVGVYRILLEQSAMLQREMCPKWVDRLIEEGVEEGKRDITRFRIFTTLKSFNIDENEIREKILRFNEKCRPPEDLRRVEYHVSYLGKQWERKQGNG